MKIGKKGFIISAFLYCFVSTQVVYAEGNLTTIVINAEDDISGQLMYAIDNKDSFTENNTFEVASGSTHTVYIKDEAGNITEQTVIVPEESEQITIAAQEDPEDNEDTDYSSAPDSGYVPVEEGGGTVAEDVITTGNSNSEAKQFLTVKTKNDHTFYIIIDNESKTDNVYLLDQVTDVDLIDMVAENDAQKAEEMAEQRATDAEKNTGESKNETDQEETEPMINNKKKDTGMAGRLLMVALIGAAAGAYMYFKKKKGQKYDEDELEEDEDAADLKKNFEAVEDEEAAEEDAFYGRTTETDREEQENEEFEEAEDIAFEDEEEDGDDGVE